MNEYIRLAKYTVEYYTKNKKIPSIPVGTSRGLIRARAGVFVTLYKDEQLRGCIGTILPTRNTVAEEIIHNAISACSKDLRFPAVTETELKELTYSVDILLAPEKITSIQKLNPKNYGVIVNSGSKRGLLLPNLDGVDTVEQQINIALQKAGIGPDEEYTLERFKVIRHK